MYVLLINPKPYIYTHIANGCLLGTILAPDTVVPPMVAFGGIPGIENDQLYHDTDT